MALTIAPSPPAGGLGIGFWTDLKANINAAVGVLGDDIVVATDTVEELTDACQAIIDLLRATE